MYNLKRTKTHSTLLCRIYIYSIHCDAFQSPLWNCSLLIWKPVAETASVGLLSPVSWYLQFPLQMRNINWFWGKHLNSQQFWRFLFYITNHYTQSVISLITEMKWCSLCWCIYLKIIRWMQLSPKTKKVSRHQSIPGKSSLLTFFSRGNWSAIQIK